MRNYTPDNPVFSNQIQIVEEDDLVNADNDTAAAKQLIANDIAINERMEKCLGKDTDHGDGKDLIVTFTSDDAENPTSWTAITLFKSKEKLGDLFNKISIMAKNVRYLYKLIGSTDISKIGNGTVTGAIKNINTEIGKKVNFTDISQSAAVTVAGKKALDAIEKNASIEGTLANLISQANSNIDMRLSYFTALSQIGLTLETATSFSEICNKMPQKSVLFLNVTDSVRDTFYENGIIPTKHAGTLIIYKLGRGLVQYTTDYLGFGMYIGTATNTNFLKVVWKEITLTEVN